MNHKFIVTGSRGWNDLDAVWEALETRVSLIGGGLMYVIHGDCREGADAMAQAWVDHKDEPDIIAVRYPADWSLGRRAGPIRNQLMIDQGADEVLAFIRNNSPGASGTVRMARKAGIPVTLVRINDKEKRVTETKTKTTSDKVSHPDLETALAAFQAEMPTVNKGKTADTGKYKYKYADIADVTEAVMPLLSKHGLSFSVTPRAAENGYEIAGILMHESRSGIVQGALPLFGRTSQEIGSSITYARRYLLGCLTGVVTDEDEDGKAASETSERPQRQQVSRAASTPRVDPQQIVAEMLEATTKTQVRNLWEKHNVGGAPKEIQDQILQHANTLPEE